MLAPLIKENNKKIKEYIERKKNMMRMKSYQKLKRKHIDVEPPSKKTKHSR